MADIFISYAREDQAYAEKLARIWGKAGFDVWWDLESLRSGESFNRAIQQALAEAKCVVVLWSDNSAISKWVESEAYWAWEHDKLFSVRLNDKVPLPVPFNTIHARSLGSWDGNTDFPEFAHLTSDIAAVVGRSMPQASAPPSAPQQEARHPAEPLRTPPSAVEPPSPREPHAEPKSDASAVPSHPKRRSLRRAARMFLFAGITVATAAAVFFLAIVTIEDWQRPELVAESPQEAPVEQASGAEDKLGQISTPAPQPRVTFREALKKRYPGVSEPEPQPLIFRDCPDCPEMVVIPAGEFQMGCVSGKGCSADELPVRKVTIETSFAIGKYEVTFSEYDRFAEATGREKPSHWGRDWDRNRRPVVNISWNDAQAYAAWLSEQTGNRYRLPTEAEWEYTARGGTVTPFSTGECINIEQANFKGDEGWEDCPETGVTRGTSVAVGSLPANPWGLYEVHGNVREWVADCWHDSYRDAPKDGSAWDIEGVGNCDRRVMRGGSWNDTMGYLRSAWRIGFGAEGRAYSLGFRVAQDSHGPLR